MNETIEQVTITVSVGALELLEKTQTRVIKALNREWSELDRIIMGLEKKAENYKSRKEKLICRGTIQLRKKEMKIIQMDIERIKALGTLARSSKERQLAELQD